MSVWKTASYRDDALHHVIQNCSLDVLDSKYVLGLCNFVVEEHGNFPISGNVTSGNLRDQILAEKFKKDKDDFIRRDSDINLREFLGNPECKINEARDKLYKTLDEGHFGLKAVYWAANHILSKTLEEKPERTPDEKFIEDLAKFGFAASYHSEKDLALRQEALKECTSGGYDKGKQAIVELIRLRGYWKSRSQVLEVSDACGRRRAWPVVPEQIAPMWVHYDVYSLPGSLIFVDKFTNVNYTLLAKDIDRIEHIVMGIHSSLVYAMAYGPEESKRTDFIFKTTMKYAKLIVDSLVRCEDPNLLCRAYSVAYHWHLSTYCAVDDSVCIDEQSKKWREEQLGKQVDLHSITRIVKDLPPKEMLEVLLMYKCLPAPDYDIYGAAYRQQNMYIENSVKAIEDEAAQGTVFDEILLYHKWTMILAYYKKHGECPGYVDDPNEDVDWEKRYPHVRPSDIDFRLVNKITITGCFTWRGRSTDIMDLVKDKATCPENFKVSATSKDLRKMPVSKRNQLIDVMTRNDAIDLTSYEGSRDSIDYSVKAEDKAESAKPNGRWFFEAPTIARLKQSEYEDSIASYATYVPGCFVGKKYEDKVRQMNAITEPVVASVPYQHVYISFDIKKFSPYLPMTVHEKLDEQWADAFGVPGLNEASRIFKDGLIHYVKKGIHHTFRKIGNDFEGFSGKKLTMYHCAVMGYVIRRLRERNMITQSARFAALIDDGLLRILLPRRNFATHKENATREIENTYAKAGLRISWDKTYNSSVMCVFLNEVRMLGRSITPGLRAALKITNRADDAVASMSADLAILRSTSQGAIVAGSPLVPIYFLYLNGAYDAIRRWSKARKRLKEHSALKCFLPMSYGGLGLSTMINLSGSVSSMSTAESMAALKLIGYRYPMTRTAIMSYLNCRKRTVSGISGWLNPGRTIIDGPHLRDDRLILMVEKYLTRTLDTPVMRILLPVDAVSNMSYFEHAMTLGADIPVPLRQKIYDMSPQKAVKEISMKFLRARSIMSIVPRRMMIRVAFANKREAANVLSRF
jgi:hypothetical protein